MTELVIAGIGQIPTGEHWERSLRDMAVDAIQAAIADAGGIRPQALYIGNMLAGTLSGQANLGSVLVDYAGLDGIEGMTIEAGGASGGAALHTASMAVASGLVDTALVVGVEKVTDQVGAGVNAALTQMLDSDYESVHGATPLAQSGLLMQRYLYTYKPVREAFGGAAVTAHANAAGNPNAYFKTMRVSREAYAAAEMNADPLNIYDTAPYTDGAAALLVTRAELIPPGFPHPLVRIAGSSVVTDAVALHDRPDPLVLTAARLSVERACRQAGIDPRDVDFFELWDESSILAVLSLEAAGFAASGEGWKLLEDGAVGLKGEMPIAVMGGLKGRGNPVGATGIYQVVEAVQQLRGEAGTNQIPGVNLALVQCLGGPAATAATHVVVGG